MTIDDIRTIAVVGAGQMGRGIAQVLATAGWSVLLLDETESVLARSLVDIQAGLRRAVEKGLLSPDQPDPILNRIHPMDHLDQLQEAQLVIEAVTENFDVKQQLFKQLDHLCLPSTVLASNTSSISITTLANVTNRPDLVVGIHFMNPVPVMRLVEVVQGRDTSAHTITLALDLTRRLGKVAVCCHDSPGFLVNRILIPMINEAVYALEAGVGTCEAIDLAMTAGANHPVGPLALADRIGLDTVLAICEVLHQDLHDQKFCPCPLLRTYVEEGRLGKKTGRGFYDYQETRAGAALPPSHKTLAKNLITQTVFHRVRTDEAL